MGLTCKGELGDEESECSLKMHLHCAVISLFSDYKHGLVILLRFTCPCFFQTTLLSPTMSLFSSVFTPCTRINGSAARREFGRVLPAREYGENHQPLLPAPVGKELTVREKEKMTERMIATRRRSLGPCQCAGAPALRGTRGGRAACSIPGSRAVRRGWTSELRPMIFPFFFWGRGPGKTKRHGFPFNPIARNRGRQRGDNVSRVPRGTVTLQPGQ